MKKLYTFLLFSTFLTLSSYGQLEFYVQGDPTNTNYAGGTYSFTAPDTNKQEVYIDVVNPTGMDSMFIISRRRLNPQPPASWKDGVCWQGASGFGLCVPYFVMNMEYYQLNPNNADQISQNTPAELKPEIKAHYDDPGTFTYRYYVGTVYNPQMDSIDVEMTLEPLSVPETTLTVGIHPNPASETITIEADGFETADVKIVDVLGNIVLISKIAGSTKINVGDYRNGIYFVTISTNGKSVSRKLIVRH